MKIAHIGLYVKDLNKMKQFYCDYFGATISNLYHNPQNQFMSYFLTFKNGARLELMQQEGISSEAESQALGYAHVAFALGSKEAVDCLTKKLERDGYIVRSHTRVTGDGYYESVVVDPEGNRIELTV